MHRLACLAALVAIAPLPLAVHSAPQSVIATPIPLDPHDPGRTGIGRLRYLGGWVLKGSDRRFGGISSMTLENGRFEMLSDGGVITRLRFTGAGPQAEVAISELPAGPGDGTAKVDRDSESSTYDPVSGHVWAGFETANQIWRYTRGFAAAEGHVAPEAMADWPGNEGAEAMVRLRDGRFLVFAETRTRKDGSHLALLFPGDPVEGAKPVEFGYRGPPHFAPTDAAELPDGRVIVLHRRFGVFAGFSAAITMIDPRAIRAGGDVTGVPLATIAPPLNVDNMEALAIEPRPEGPVLWIASDDNYFVGERTLLMKFALPRDF